ncbi:MAG: type II secretion system F family protein [Planctomycetes bacterium]|nr:type II secretion system F family protein [Planctomycetota bacterium]
MQAALALLLWLGLMAVTTHLALRWVQRQRARERLFAGAPAPAPTRQDAEPQGALGRWLLLAGYDAPGAPGLFVALTALAAALGATVAWAVLRSGLIELAVRFASIVPGGVGEMVQPILQAAPWLVVAMFAVTPWAVVCRARTARVTQVERDLPMALELLATLGEAGLGFDAALDRILDGQPPGRALADELRAYQRDALAGVARVAALRGVARRLDVPAVSVLVSALVQADQIGASLTEALRRQADDLRNRRRERALMLSEALPVKLVFPLVICFLPGIFIVTLGPAFYQFLQVADSAIRGGR